MIVLIPDINLVNLSWIIKCLFLRTIVPLIWIFLDYLPVIRGLACGLGYLIWFKILKEFCPFVS